MTRYLLPLSVLSLLTIMGSALAQRPPVSLLLPVACEINEDCWVMNYVDMESDTEISRDFTCGGRSYDSHNGTDIAIRSMHEFEKGVDVKAAVGGFVFRAREGEKDAFKDQEEMDRIRQEEKGCGNGIIIDHGAGFLTQYCHLKNGSLQVQKGDKVRAGQKIAQVGLSGVSEHPHLHFSVIYDGKMIDPFTGNVNGGGCNLESELSVWSSPEMLYTPFSLYDGGFTAQEPDFTQISQGQRGESPKKDSDVLIFWGVYFGAKPEDLIEINIIDPKGNILAERSLTQDHLKARQYYFVGQKKPEGGWMKGTYKAEIKVSRGENVQTLQKALDIF